MGTSPSRLTVSIHFQPDWPSGTGGDELVVEAMARDGAYRSQFETGTSNGGLTAHPGGDRWVWESRLFEGRYDAGPASARPVYGALDRGTHPHGPAIRFGSAHLRLRPSVVERATFCFPDSFLQPERVVGVEEVAPLEEAAVAAAHDDLDDYVEAHVHGGVRFAEDVEALVLDPCFRGGRVEEAASRLGCPVEWHPGFRVATAGLPEEYRGPAPLALARSLARSSGGHLVPSTVGDARRTGSHDPQTVKQVWHLLARYGRG